MALAVPLTESQVEAANRLAECLALWEACDEALKALSERFPDFGPTSCLLKVTAINALYNTNIYALPQMAEHTVKVIAGDREGSASPDLIEELASLSIPGTAKSKRFIGLASKLAHFFLGLAATAGFASNVSGSHLTSGGQPGISLTTTWTASRNTAWRRGVLS